MLFPALLLLACGGPVVTTGSAAGLTITLPEANVTFRPGPGVELAQAYCAMCHSPDYLSNQPPFDRAFWKKTVEKMRTSYGAPVPSDKVEAIADYLVKAYGTENR